MTESRIETPNTPPADREQSNTIIREALQKVIDVINKYLINPNHLDVLRGKHEVRHSNAKNIVSLIGRYYQQNILKKFNDEYDTAKSLLTLAEEKSETIDLSKTKLIPDLKKWYLEPPMPDALHQLHDLKIQLEAEIKTMWSSRGSSELATNLTEALKDIEAACEEIAKSASLIFFVESLTALEINSNVWKYAGFIHEALSQANPLYLGSPATIDDNKPNGRVTKENKPKEITKNDEEKPLFYLFASSNKLAEADMRKEKMENGAVFGSAFNFFLSKDLSKTNHPGQYVPDLKSVHSMELKQFRNGTQYSSNSVPLKYWPEENALVVTPPKLK